MLPVPARACCGQYCSLSEALKGRYAQDDLYKPNYYLSLWEFRELTLQRLQLFVSQCFFSVFDYLHGVRPAAPVSLVCLAGSLQPAHSSPLQA